MSNVDCPALIDIAEISGNYSQMSGVLAGFAFTAMVYLLTPGQGASSGAPTRRGGKELLALFAAFFALIITTLIYSVLAGENVAAARPRAATSQLVNGVVFGLAGIMLLQGVTLLMRRSAVEPVVVLTARVVTVVVLPVLAYNYVVNGVTDVNSARAERSGTCIGLLPNLGIYLTLVLAVVLAASLTPPFRRVPWRKYSQRFQVAAPLTVLVVSVVAAIVFGFVTTRSPGFIPSPIAVNGYLIGYFLLLMLLGLILSYGDVGQEDPHQDSSSSSERRLPEAQQQRPKAEQPKGQPNQRAAADGPVPRQHVGHEADAVEQQPGTDS